MTRHLPDMTLAEVCEVVRLDPEYAARVLRDRDRPVSHRHYSQSTHDRLPPMKKQGGRYVCRARTFAAWRADKYDAHQRNLDLRSRLPVRFMGAAFTD